eukprot:SAG25_NODE_9050_length_390_cov_1.243986_2_plen_54_part_01
MLFPPNESRVGKSWQLVSTYTFLSTVVLDHVHGVQLRGSGGAVAEFTVPPQVTL